MSDILVGYLAAFAVTLLIIGLACAALFRYRSLALACDQEHEELTTHLARLPEATRWSDLTEKVADLEQQHELYKDEEQAARQTIDEAQRLQDDISRHKDELLRLEAEREEQEKLRAALAALKQELPQLDEQRRKLKDQTDAAGFDRDRLREEANRLEETRDKRQGEVEDIENRIEQAKKLESNIETKLTALGREEEAARQHLQRVREELSTLEHQRQQMAERRDNLDKEAAQLDRDRNNLQQEKRDLERRVDQLKKQIDDLHLQGAADPENAGRELWNPVLSTDGFKSMPEAQEEEEQDCLERVQDYLQSCGLRFSERTVYGLHTALKIADMSPLTVLAGISGTGKSELPRRYAEAMGMHFLPVAVQPRWDSPQDMFGFFNYLEGRFRPTELTRALIQMDSIGSQPGRGWQPPDEWDGRLKDQMLLVLMDEMNLARVEYYFSEFLSKLETRRGIDPSDSSKRAKAELTLEMGQGGEEGQSNLMRLFVNTNVLFVGTMNEDESTQTLSDKVIDRANLLRFGKPNRLFAPESSNGRVKQIPVLRGAHWQQWVRPEDHLTGQANEEVNAYLGRLNKLTGEVGRPFGYRMYRAMRAYVANYPDFADQPIESAISDQIEQRILPRLRGLDLHESSLSEALDQLRSLVGDLGDESLQHAIDQASDRRHHQFNWQGLDRTETESPLVGAA